MNPARTEFARIAAREPIPLARGALLIAKEEYPDLDIAHYLEHLAALAREAESALREAEDTVEQMQTLSDFLFEQKGFEGNRDNYADPRNSFLNDVLDRRLGIPITLSVHLSRSRQTARPQSLRRLVSRPISWSRRSTSAAS